MKTTWPCAWSPRWLSHGRASWPAGRAVFEAVLPQGGPPGVGSASPGNV